MKKKILRYLYTIVDWIEEYPDHLTREDLVKMNNQWRNASESNLRLIRDLMSDNAVKNGMITDLKKSLNSQTPNKESPTNDVKVSKNAIMELEV